MKMLEIGPEKNCNFNETSFSFSPKCKQSLTRKGAKMVAALRADSSQRCSVILGVSAGGHKLPPYIIYKGMNTPGRTIGRQLRRIKLAANGDEEECEGFSTSLFYAVQNKGWMTLALMVNWITKIYKPWCKTKTGLTMLILNAFSRHQISAVRDAVVDCGDGLLEFIHAGYTWKLKVMYVGINKLFKDCIWDEYN
jgi:DDE superfamily endonuclease